MKLDLTNGGYFEKGKFFPINRDPDECDLFSCLPVDVQKTIASIEKISHDFIAINFPCMPDFVCEEGIVETNIFLILREAYLSIIFGNYNAGLLLLGQLLEVVTKEIILINTGKSLPNATFGNAIQHAEDKKILLEEDIRFLKEFNKNIRNAYSHYKLSEIIGNDIKVPLWKIPINQTEKFDPEKFLINLAKIQKGIKEGTYRPSFVDPLEFPAIAAIIKENIDRKKVILWFWRIASKLDQFSKIYLTQEKYQLYIKKLGKMPYEDVTPITINSTDERK